MKISICIPQFNRIELLKKNLAIISRQTYPDIEVIVSDDCSTDNTREEIEKIRQSYKYPVTYFRFDANQGYDRNYRKSLEIATGEYGIVLGNDDSLYGDDAIEKLASYLERFNYPDIGYCNYVEEMQPGVVIERAFSTSVHGSGVDVALKHFNGFSFVAGIIYKKAVFDKFNTAKHDGSIYAQMYLGLLMIASGCRFFTIADPLVLKDLSDEKGKTAVETYKNRLPKNWKQYRKADGGLPGVSNVLISALQDATGREDKKLAYTILKRIYGVTFPYWIIQYKKYGSMAASIGLIQGLFPPATNNWPRIGSWGKIRLFGIYTFMSLAGILIPSAVFGRMENKLRRLAKN